MSAGTNRERNTAIRVSAISSGTSQKGRFAVFNSNQQGAREQERTRKPMPCVRRSGGRRWAGAGRMVLPQVQAAEDVLYDATSPRPEPSRDGRRTRSCRGLTVVAHRQTDPATEDRPLALATGVADQAARPRPELAFYRKYTEAMLRRYVRMSTEAGRTPSLLGREMFRARVTSYRVKSFEDVVIFCMDVERCLEKLQPGEKALIKRIALQEYSHGEAAGILGMSLRGVIQRYGAALDRLTGILLAAGMMEPLRKLAEAYETGSVAS